MASAADSNCTYSEVAGHSVYDIYVNAPYESVGRCNEIKDHLLEDLITSVDDYECYPAKDVTHLTFTDRLKNGHNANIALNRAFGPPWEGEICASGYEGVHFECSRFDMPGVGGDRNHSYYELILDWDITPSCVPFQSALLANEHFGLKINGHDNEGNCAWNCYLLSGGTTGQRTRVKFVGALVWILSPTIGDIEKAWQDVGIYGLDFDRCTSSSAPCLPEYGCYQTQIDRK